MKYLTRQEAAAYINECGLPCSPKTLAKLACTGGGPTYQRFGLKAVYTPENLDRWIKSKLSGPMASTSDVQVVGG